MTFSSRPRSLEQLKRLADESLCREVSQGNQEAFLVLFDRYWGQVFRLANAVIRDEAEAEDLAQSLFLEVHASMLRFDEQKGLFRALLLRYAYTRAIDQRRKLESRRFYSSIQFDELDPSLLVQESKAPSALSPEEATRLIEQALKHLDEKQRVVVEAYFFRGLSLNEIAHEQHDSFGNARHYLYRGLEKMRKVLGARGEAEEQEEMGLRIETRAPRTVGKRVAPEVSVVRARTI